MKKIFIVFIIIFYGVAGKAQTWQDTLSQIEKLFIRYQPNNPGCELSISRNGNVIFSKAWGMADLEHNVVLTKESIIEAGSVSKQFTAAAILLLEQQHKLSLDDDVRKYIPELPDYGTPIKLRYMMHHTSGLRDWGSIAAIAGWPRTTKTYSNNDALDIIIHQKDLNNKPNDEFIYSNSNYNLFAIIVERVSGMSLAEFTLKNIFEPAGMSHTQWRNNYKRIVLNRAVAYDKTKDGYEMDMPNENVYGNGGLLTTTEDLLKWNDFFWGGKLGNPSLLPKQLAVDTLNNGTVNNYGAGLFIKQSRGLNYVQHSGATAGYRAYLAKYPQLNFSIAWLSNTSQFDTASQNIVKQVENLFIKDVSVAVKDSSSKPEQTEPKAAVADAAFNELKQFTGEYNSDEAQTSFIIFERNEKLLLHQAAKTDITLTHIEKDHFEADDEAFDGSGGTIEFVRTNNKVTGLKITISRARNVEFIKVK